MKPWYWIFVLTSIIASCFSTQSLPDNRMLADIPCQIRYRHSVLNRCEGEPEQSEKKKAVKKQVEKSERVCEHHRCDGKRIVDAARSLLKSKTP